MGPESTPTGSDGRRASDAASRAIDGTRLYDPSYVRALFDEMSATYERVNTLTSFGFSRRWRRQVVERLAAGPGATVLDAMAGMGEGWRYLAPAIGPSGRIVAVDLSEGMLRGARRERERLARTSGRLALDRARVTPSGGATIEIVHGDALASGLGHRSVDAVLCLFGLKTLSPVQREAFAIEIERVLRPGGRFALVEVSTPPNRLLHAAYLFYLKEIIPVLGRLLLGNPENYRMLGRYTERFGDATPLVDVCRGIGLEAAYLSLFFGCATGIVGSKPAT